MNPQWFPFFTGCMVFVLFGVIVCALYLWFPFSQRKRSSSPVYTMITQLVRWSFYAGVFSFCLNVSAVTLAVGWDWLLRGWSGGLAAIVLGGVVVGCALLTSKSARMNAWLSRQAYRWDERFRRDE
ncbi:hypothetical protein KSF_086950 [Reticulibacter mediterranei]|uniref:Uncharacterized protein n=1 Tax=Reticulibacter mediterranei TaxID=2778369 RepID=A0A8J3N4W1_9CHLR|nr:hypothetical protein [Reticulibacter mediterranei]GHO98647.1 hypothetical protein KSF_086950 [Reticulibacter mediterranei]